MNILRKIIISLFLSITLFGIINASENRFQFESKWGQYWGEEVRAVEVSKTEDAVYIATLAEVQKFQKDGTFVTKWGKTGIEEEDGKFYSIRDIGIDISSNVWVVDSNSTIQKFDKDGNFIARYGTYGSGDGEFDNPYGIAFDSDKNIYIADRENYRIQKFDKDFNFIAKWGINGAGDGEFELLSGIVIDNNDIIYTADAGNYNNQPENNNRIQKFDTSGTFQGEWGTSGTLDGYFNLPEGLGIDDSNNIYVADLGNDRIQVFTSAGAFIRKFGTEGSSDGEFDYPHSVSVDSSGKIYVADGYNSRIQKFSDLGVFDSSWVPNGASNGNFNMPEGISFTDYGSGYIFITDTFNDRIMFFEKDGTYATSLGRPELGEVNRPFQPSDIAFNSSDEFFVVSRGDHKIKKYNMLGSFLEEFGGAGSSDGKFSRPVSITIDNSNIMYVVDQYNYRIQKFDSSGNYILQWGENGYEDGKFYKPESIAVDSSGNVYVTDSVKENVQKFSSTGIFILKWGGAGTLDGNFNEIKGISIDNQGDIYVVDHYNQRIQKFDSDGQFIAKWGGTNGTGDLEFDYPIDIAFDDDNNMYITDTYNNRIQKLAYFNKVSGKVKDSITSEGINGSTVSLTGYSSDTYITDSSGDYEFYLKNNESYLIDAYNENVTSFNPSNRSHVNITADASDQDFEGTHITEIITGYVKDNIGSGIQGTTVTLSGTLSETYLTSSDGYYTFIVYSGGDYDIEPSYDGYDFSPSSYTYNYLQIDKYNQDFTGEEIGHNISGYIRTAGSIPIENIEVTIMLIDYDISVTIYTDSSGYYEFENIESGNDYSVVPSSSFYMFDPEANTYDSLNQDQLNQDFTGYYLYSISGKVIDPDNSDIGIEDVTVTLKDMFTDTILETVLTDANGEYYLTKGIEGASLVVSVEHNDYMFFNSEMYLGTIGANISGIDFEGEQAQQGSESSYKISGYVKDQNDNPIADITIEYGSYGGLYSGSENTEGSGYYEFWVPGGLDYEITPVSADYDFTPNSINISNLSDIQYNIDFSAINLAVLHVSETNLDFGTVQRGESKTMHIEITNVGSMEAVLSVTNIESDKEWLSVNQREFVSNQAYVDVNIDGNMLTDDGSYNATLTITSNGGNAVIDVTVQATCVLTKPNPYNNNTGDLKFYGSGVISNDTTIQIFTINGEHVRTLHEDQGLKEISWNGRNADGSKVASGVYIYASDSPKEKWVGKFTILKR